MEPIAERIRKALDADMDGIRLLLHDPSKEVVSALLSNRNITEDELVVLARRRDLPGELLGAIGGRRHTAEDYKVKLALVNNPRTPRRTALGLLRHLQLRDMAFLTRNKALPTELRQAAEGMLKEKMPTLPLGIRVTLARQVSDEVLKAVLMDPDPQLIRACFENPVMKESLALWAVNHERVPGGVVEFIAMSPRWSASKQVRYALMRNRATPVTRALEFVPAFTSSDQRLLYNDPAVPVAVKVRIEIELEKKGERLSPPAVSGRIIGIPEDE